MEAKLEIRYDVYAKYKITLIITKDIPASRESFSDLLGRQDSQLSEYVDALHSYSDLHPDAMIFVQPNVSVGTLAHECSHAIRRMFDYVGASMANEHFEYHLEHLLDNFYNHIKMYNETQQVKQT